MVVLIFHSIIFMKVSYVSKGGGEGGYDPPLSPRSPHPLPPLREVKIAKIFEIVT